MEQVTIYYKDYLASGYTLPDNIDNFVTLTIGGSSYNIKELFNKRNYYKEIGSETEELFKHNLEVLIDEALAIYNPRLVLLQQNFNTLMSRTVSENKSGSISNNKISNTTANSENEDYLNPANSGTTANPKLQNKMKNNGNSNLSESISNSYNEQSTKALSYFKSNPEILKIAYEVSIVVSEILKYLDKAFLGLY